MAQTLNDSLFRDVRNPVWVFDNESFRVLDVNEIACRRYGYSREEFLAMTLYDIRTPAEQEFLKDWRNETTRVWEHRTKSGMALLAEVHTFPFDNEPGHESTLAMLVDVTERAKLGRERAELLERYQILSEAANDLLWEWDLRTDRITQNGALSTLFGYDPADIRDDVRWWSELMHPDDYRACAWSINEAIRERKRYWSAEYRFKKADGTYVPVLDRGIIQTDENEQPLRMIGSIVDLTLRQSNRDERNQLFGLSLDSMLVLDSDGSIRQANEAFYTLAGIEAKAEGVLSIRDFLSQKDLVPFEDALGRAISDGLEGHFATSLDTVSGRGKTIQWGLNINEDRNRVILVGHDITQSMQARQDLEAALALSRQLELEAQAANKAQSEFLQNMSHELRTPMNGLLGTAQLLADSAVNERQSHLASILMRSGESLLQILNDILDFSKVEAGEVSLDSAPLYLPEVIETVIDLFSLTARQKGLDLSATISPTADIMVIGDQFRLRQVISNLIGNAIKFTDKGHIHVSLGVKQLKKSRVEASIAVRDSGAGIPGEMQGRIFERFVQVDSSLTRRHGGTGLGLSITKTLVEAMGGQISLISQVGRGSEFTVLLPFESVDKSNQILTAHEYQPICSRPGTKVLIAEDVEVNAIILTSWLQDRGFECVTAGTGGEALDQLARHDFDGLFLDLHMPDYSGYEVIDILRKRENGSGSRIPVVAVTASVSLAEKQKCFSHDFDDYIPKPIIVADLDRVIKRLFAERE